MIDTERAAIVANKYYGQILEQLFKDDWLLNDINTHWPREQVRTAFFKFLTSDHEASFELKEEALRFTVARLGSILHRQRHPIVQRSEDKKEEAITLCSHSIKLKNLMERMEKILTELNEMANTSTFVPSSPETTPSTRPSPSVPSR